MTNGDMMADKQFYDELTDKQKTVVDYLAENPDANYMDAERETGIHNTYVGGIDKKYSHIIEERKQVLANSHMKTENGNVTVEGSIDLTDEPGEQSFSERPVKSISDGGDDDEEVYDPEVFIDLFIEDDSLVERIEAIGDEITPNWMDQSATPVETVRYLARFYYGEVSE